ncbi:MAG TPA: tetratricopeptide repeat protein [bacterium]|nr:tetratricopeptide repeat protein [bacterium]
MVRRRRESRESAKDRKAISESQSDSVRQPLSSSWFDSPKAAILALLLLGFVAHWRVLGAGFVWDDYLIYENLYVRSLSGIWKIWTNLAVQPESDVRYWPLFYSTFWLDYVISGIHPVFSHGVNLLIHLANILLVWHVLKRLAFPGALLAAAIFAAHPVHSESVAWVIERKGLLSMLFFLLAFRAHLQFVNTKDVKTLGVAVLMLALSLLSKPVAVVFPVVVVLWMYWKGIVFSKRNLLFTVPYFALSAVSGLLNVLSSRLYDPVSFGFTPAERLLIVGRAFWFYVSKLIAPYSLAMIYERWSVDTGNFLQWLFPISAVLLFVLLWWARSRIGKEPLIAFSLFFVILSPVLGFVDYSHMAYSFVANRYQYLASVPLIALFSAGILRWARARIDLHRSGFSVVLGFILIILCLLSWQQDATFKSMETLFRHNIKVNPNAAAAHDSLGLCLLQRGEPMQAQKHFQRALELEPHMLEAIVNLGLAFAHQDKADQAIEQYEKALAIDPDNAPALTNLGNIYARLGRYDESLRWFNRLVEIGKASPQILNSLAASYAYMGRFEEAVETVQKAIDQAHQQGDVQMAIGLERILQLYRSGQTVPRQ